jgi:RNAse (barnase) inhibitor barstar
MSKNFPNLKRNHFYSKNAFLGVKTDPLYKKRIDGFPRPKKGSKKMAERKDQSVVFRKVIVQSCDFSYDEFMKSFDQGDYTKQQLNILWDKLYKEYDDVKQDPIVWIKETTYTTIEEERLTESCVIKALDNWQESDEISKLRDKFDNANEINNKMREFIKTLPRTLNKKEHQQIFKDFPQLKRVPFKTGYDKAEWSNNNNNHFQIDFIKEEK